MASDEEVVKEILGVDLECIRTDPDIFVEDLIVELAKRLYKLEALIGKMDT